MSKIPEYKEVEEWHLIDKIKIFGWLSDMMTKINPDAISAMHRNKLRRIKRYSMIINKPNPCGIRIFEGGDGETIGVCGEKGLLCMGCSHSTRSGK